MRSNFTRYLHELSDKSKTKQLDDLSNIECKDWLIEILTNTYVAFLFCDRSTSSEIDSNLKIPLNLRDGVPD